MPRIKELTAFDKEFTPKIQVHTRLPTSSRIQEDEPTKEREEDEHEESGNVPNIRIPRSKISHEPTIEGSKRRTHGREPGFYTGQYYLEGSQKYLAEGNLLSFDYTMAADPRYFQESSTREKPNDSKRLVGEVMFDLPVQERVW